MNHIENINIIQKGQQKRRKRYWIVGVVLSLMTVILCILMMTVGNTFYRCAGVNRREH